MELEGRISMHINTEDYSFIEIKDYNSNTRFIRLKLTGDQLVRILSREGNVECKLEVIGLDLVGKKHECKKFEFVIPETHNRYDGDSDEKLHKIAQSILDKNEGGWIADKYFSSQTSFFTNKEDKRCARCTIRRWI